MVFRQLGCRIQMYKFVIKINVLIFIPILVLNYMSNFASFCANNVIKVDI